MTIEDIQISSRCITYIKKKVSHPVGAGYGNYKTIMHNTCNFEKVQLLQDTLIRLENHISKAWPQRLGLLGHLDMWI